MLAMQCIGRIRFLRMRIKINGMVSREMTWATNRERLRAGCIFNHTSLWDKILYQDRGKSLLPLGIHSLEAGSYGAEAITWPVISLWFEAMLPDFCDIFTYFCRVRFKRPLPETIMFWRQVSTGVAFLCGGVSKYILLLLKLLCYQENNHNQLHQEKRVVMDL